MRGQHHPQGLLRSRLLCRDRGRGWCSGRWRRAWTCSCWCWQRATRWCPRWCPFLLPRGWWRCTQHGAGESERASQPCSEASTPARPPAPAGPATPLLSTHQNPCAEPQGAAGQYSAGLALGPGLGPPALGTVGSGRDGAALESLEACLSSPLVPRGPGPLGPAGEALELGGVGAPEAALGLRFQGSPPTRLRS